MRRLLLASALLCSAPWAFATDLMDAFRAAAAHDATYSAARYALSAGEEKNEQARALWLPRLDLAANSNYEMSNYKAGNPTDSDPSSNRHGATYGYSVTATQPVYDVSVSAGSTQLQKEAAQAQVQWRQAQQDLVLRVAQAYFDVLAAQQKITLAEAQKQAVSEQLAQAKKMFEVGTATITDTNDAQARYDAIVASEIAAQNDLDSKRNVFALLTALDANALATPSPNQTPTPPDPPRVSDWLSMSVQHNANIEQQALAVDIATAEIDKYRWQTAPTVSVVGSYGDRWDRSGISKSTGIDTTTGGSIGLQLSVPLYTGGNRSSQYRAAIATREQQRDLLEAARRTANQQVTTAFLGVQSGAAQIQSLNQAVKSSASSLESTRVGRQVGVRTTVDVLNAEQTYFQARYDLEVARYQYLLSRLQLAAAAGTLDFPELETVNRWLIQDKNN
ncbi:TolC family outer membrane protein [Amantichitinum ursilacus]|nr:TolC family outer membrane protein [Amantichitinum ursilacus]